MDKVVQLSGTVELWQLLTLAGTGLLAGAALYWKHVALTSDMDALRCELEKVELDAKHVRLSQGQFELTVTDRLARLETTMSQGLRQIESAIRDALKS